MFSQPYIAANSHLFLDTSWISIPALHLYLKTHASDRDKIVTTAPTAVQPAPPRVKRESDASDASLIDGTVKSEPVVVSVPVRTRSHVESGREVIELLSDSDDDDTPTISGVPSATVYCFLTSHHFFTALGVRNQGSEIRVRSQESNSGKFIFSTQIPVTELASPSIRIWRFV
jgi:hypothetical protein